MKFGQLLPRESAPWMAAVNCRGGGTSCGGHEIPWVKKFESKKISSMSVKTWKYHEKKAENRGILPEFPVILREMQRPSERPSAALGQSLLACWEVLFSWPVLQWEEHIINFIGNWFWFHILLRNFLLKTELTAVKSSFRDDRLIDWLIKFYKNWLIDWLIKHYSVRLIDWLIKHYSVRLIDWLIKYYNTWLIDWLID